MRNLELILNKLLKDEKHQTRVSLLLELVSDAYLTANRTWDLYSSTQVTIVITAALRPSVVRDLWSSGIVTYVEDYRSEVRFAVR